MDETKDRHDTCVHADACERLYLMHSRLHEIEAYWLRCNMCDAYDSQHCPMAYSGTMRCRGLR